MNPLMNPVGSNAEGKLNCINAVVITHVGASFVSLAPIFSKSERTHAAAPPFQIDPAAPGFDLVLGAELKTAAWLLPRYCKAPKADVFGAFLITSSLFTKLAFGALEVISYSE